MARLLSLHHHIASVPCWRVFWSSYLGRGGLEMLTRANHNVVDSKLFLQPSSSSCQLVASGSMKLRTWKSHQLFSSQSWASASSRDDALDIQRRTNSTMGDSPKDSAPTLPPASVVLSRPLMTANNALCFEQRMGCNNVRGKKMSFSEYASCEFPPLAELLHGRFQAGWRRYALAFQSYESMPHENRDKLISSARIYLRRALQEGADLTSIKAGETMALASSHGGPTVVPPLSSLSSMANPVFRGGSIALAILPLARGKGEENSLVQQNVPPDPASLSEAAVVSTSKATAGDEEHLAGVETRNGKEDNVLPGVVMSTSKGRRKEEEEEAALSTSSSLSSSSKLAKVRKARADAVAEGRRRMGKVEVVSEEDVAKEGVAEGEVQEGVTGENDLVQGSEAWLALRRWRLTASSFGNAVGMWTGGREALWEEKVGLREPMASNEAMSWGMNSEAKAIQRYCEITEHEVEKMAFCVYREGEDEHSWLGASPDGLVAADALSLNKGRGLLEVKCPFNKGRPLAATPYPRVPHYYIPQAQGLMEILDRDWLDFYVWTVKGSVVFRVERDPAYWAMLHSAMAEFWWQNVVPARLALLNNKGKEEVALYRPRDSELTAKIVETSKRLAEGCRTTWIEKKGRAYKTAIPLKPSIVPPVLFSQSE
eukprot:TRINITY_DN5893_c0_g2_i2.p1 TRINITY_DN5893_c0_g2~~TRINITY_DN5893_c0_g2_i2.p1  ORF type:complete len:655 (+),score=99.73 TRINITY_DN5893_c0_g2_i2:71-2035(+)